MSFPFSFAGAKLALTVQGIDKQIRSKMVLFNTIIQLTMKFLKLPVP